MSEDVNSFKYIDKITFLKIIKPLLNNNTLVFNLNSFPRSALKEKNTVKSPYKVLEFWPLAEGLWDNTFFQHILE